MKSVLIPHQTSNNIYIRELGRAYEALGWRVVYGSENLLECNLSPDLVHLQWPEEMYRWRGDGTPTERVAHFEQSLARLRQQNVPMAMTIHNLAPHEHFDNPLDRRAYQFAISNASVIHHHCEKSQGWLGELYSFNPDTQHVVAPHGHYGAYPNTVDAASARAQLGIPPGAFVYLHFGLIRGYKGISNLLAAFDQLKLPSKYLLIAGQYSKPGGWAGLVERTQLVLKKRLSGNLKLVGTSIPSSEIQLYANAANCLVMSHRAGLNSGVAVLGMSFGKVVIGPALGCIESVLGSGRNVTFQPGSTQALTDAMAQCAAKPDLAADGAFNHQVAQQWTWTRIAQAVLDKLPCAA